MIHPVRAVFHPAWRIGHAFYAPPWCKGLWSAAASCRDPGKPLWLRLAAGRGHLSHAEGARGGPGQACADFRIPHPQLEFPPFRLAVPGEPALQWKPWPVEPPFIDRVRIHWPSDDWPPVPPPVVIEDELPDAPPQIILWREVGGLLDMWA